MQHEFPILDRIKNNLTSEKIKEKQKELDPELDKNLLSTSEVLIKLLDHGWTFGQFVLFFGENLLTVLILFEGTNASLCIDVEDFRKEVETMKEQIEEKQRTPSFLSVSREYQIIKGLMGNTL